MDNLIPVTKDGEYIEVHPTTFGQHKALGWRECEKQEQPDEGVTLKASDGLTVAEIKTALEAHGIAVPEGVTLKADLAALLDAPAA